MEFWTIIGFVIRAQIIATIRIRSRPIMIFLFLDFQDKLAIIDIDVLWDECGVHKRNITQAPSIFKCIKVIAEVQVKVARF